MDMVTERLSKLTKMSEIFNTTDWETASFEVHARTYHAPKFKFIHAGMFLGKENSVLKALEQMSSTTSYPIRVDESITESDFETLLSLLYPSCAACAIQLCVVTNELLFGDLAHVDIPLKDLWTKDQYLSVLKVSSIWFHQDLRSLALKYLDVGSLSPTGMVSLGRAYSVPEWVVNGLCVLCHSHTLLETLGHWIAFRIYQIREQEEFPEARSNEDQGKFTTEYSGVDDDVRRAFCDELDMRREYYIAQALLDI